MIKDFQCIRCVHYKNDLVPGEHCAAFEDGIPLDIIIADFIHTKPYPGQKNNIVFEPKNES